MFSVHGVRFLRAIPKYGLMEEKHVGAYKFEQLIRWNFLKYSKLAERN